MLNRMIRSLSVAPRLVLLWAACIGPVATAGFVLGEKRGALLGAGIGALFLAVVSCLAEAGICSMLRASRKSSVRAGLGLSVQNALEGLPPALRGTAPRVLVFSEPSPNVVIAKS